MKPETTQDDPVLKALKAGANAMFAIRGNDSEIVRAMVIQKAQVTVLKTARKYLEFQRALPGSSTEDYEIWSELDDGFAALDKLKEGK